MSLDTGTAGELLKSVKPELVTEIAAELACLRAPGQTSQENSTGPIREFISMLEGAPAGDSQQFLGAVLANAMGKDRSLDLLARVQRLVEARDPFGPIRSASAVEIAAALAGESAQVIALVLSELPAKKSSELLGLLDDEIRSRVVCGMVGGEKIPAETSLRVAKMVQAKLTELSSQARTGAGEVQKDGQVRKLALLLRDLKKDIRDGLIASLRQQDEQTGDSVSKQMVVWDDVKLAADRPLQEILRLVDAKDLALAMIGADRQTAAKVRQNMSERASAMLDEEASLLSSPKPEDIDQAREDLLDKIRESHAQGEMTFEESQ